MKKGITLVSLIIALLILVILAGVVVVNGINSLKETEITKYAVELINIQNMVDMYYMSNNSYPIKNEEYVLDMSNVPQESIGQFKSETITSDTITFKKLDLELIGIDNNEYGKNSTSDDVYVVSTETGKVYYILGVTYKNIVYYTLDEDLYSYTGMRENININQNETKKYDVIFTSNNINETNEPVVVTIKLPKDATVNSITATESKIVSAEVLEGNYKVYSVNETGSSRNGNYVVTVNYTYNGVIKEVSYEVSNFNNEKPVIQYTQTTNGGIRDITLNVTGNQIKNIKYEETIISDPNYFKYFGKKVTNNTIRISEDSSYTIYAEDKAGNYEMKKVNLSFVDPQDYIEYNVGYTDMYQQNNVFTAVNGWRLVKVTKNADGSYSDLVIISTGIPAKLFYNYNDASRKQ